VCTFSPFSPFFLPKRSREPMKLLPSEEREALSLEGLLVVFRFGG
jgi:hypothetical protein